MGAALLLCFPPQLYRFCCYCCRRRRRRRAVAGPARPVRVSPHRLLCALAGARSARLLGRLAPRGSVHGALAARRTRRATAARCSGSTVRGALAQRCCCSPPVGQSAACARRGWVASCSGAPCSGGLERRARAAGSRGGGAAGRDGVERLL